MSNPVESSSTPVGEFQTHFGIVPGTQDARAECAKWQSLCADLLAERDRLRAELAEERAAHEKTVLQAMHAQVDPNMTMEQVYANVDRETSFDQLLAEIDQRLEAKK